MLVTCYFFTHCCHSNPLKTRFKKVLRVSVRPTVCMSVGAMKLFCSSDPFAPRNPIKKKSKKPEPVAFRRRNWEDRTCWSSLQFLCCFLRPQIAVSSSASLRICKGQPIGGSCHGRCRRWLLPPSLPPFHPLTHLYVLSVCMCVCVCVCVFLLCEVQR